MEKSTGIVPRAKRPITRLPRTGLADRSAMLSTVTVNPQGKRMVDAPKRNGAIPFFGLVLELFSVGLAMKRGSRLVRLGNFLKPIILSPVRNTPAETPMTTRE